MLTLCSLARQAGWRYISVAGAILLAAVAALAFWKEPRAPRSALPERGAREEIALPPPATTGGASLADALSGRRSRREFADRPVSPGMLSQLCWSAQGTTARDPDRRTAPSAGALYPLTVYLVDASGVSEYVPQRHALLRSAAEDVRSALQGAALGQRSVGAAPLCLVIAMDVSRTAAKYGARAKRYCLLEAGHVAQNVLLQATALGLVGVPVAAMNEDKVRALLRLPLGQSPVYLLPLGHPPGDSGSG